MTTRTRCQCFPPSRRFPNSPVTANSVLLVYRDEMGLSQVLAVTSLRGLELVPLPYACDRVLGAPRPKTGHCKTHTFTVSSRLVSLQNRKFSLLSVHKDAP